MNTFQAIHANLQAELNSQQFPSFLNQAVEHFHHIHLFYRTYKQALIFTEEAKISTPGHSAIYGAGIQLMSQTNLIYDHALQIMLIIKCTQDLLREYHQLSDHYLLFHQAFTWQYPVYYRIDELQYHFSSILAPSIYLSISVQGLAFFYQIQKIIQCAFLVFWQIFKIAMILSDAYLIFKNDFQMRHEACTELVANWQLYKNQFHQNQQQLVEELKKHHRWIDKILNYLPPVKENLTEIHQFYEQFKETIVDPKTILKESIAVAEETLDTFYIKGKITPLHINLSQANAVAPLFPISRFPPWTGEKIVLESNKAEIEKTSFSEIVGEQAKETLSIFQQFLNYALPSSK